MLCKTTIENESSLMLKDQKMSCVVVLLGIAEPVNLSGDLCFRREETVNTVFGQDSEFSL